MLKPRTQMLSKRGMRLTALVACAALFGVQLGGCYIRHAIPADEFAKLQTAEEIPVLVTNTNDEELSVDRGSRLAVRSMEGETQLVTPFHFQITQSQFVASDRDILLPLSQVDRYEVQELNIAVVVTLSVLAAQIVAGILTYVGLTAGKATIYK